MESIREEYLSLSAAREGISARRIIRDHQWFVESLARPWYSRPHWGPIWFIGEAPKHYHVAACPSFSRLSDVWHMLGLTLPADFRDLTSTPMPKSRSRWGDVRPPLLDTAIGARRILREAVGLSGALTGDLYVVLLGATVRAALGAQNLERYRWYSLPRSGHVLGNLFLATIPHPSPIASRVFDRRRVSRLFADLRYARPRRPTRARDYRAVEQFDLVSMEQ
jgi:hypothetical protein